MVWRKLAQLESQMSTLSSLVTQPDTSTAVALLQLQQNLITPSYSDDFQSASHDSPDSRASAIHHENLTSVNSFYPANPPPQQYQNQYQPPPAKRKRGDFEVTVEPGLDVIARGLITYEDALVYFRCFFQGCVRYFLITSTYLSVLAKAEVQEQDRYVPVFDPVYDTFDSVRSRSSMLFDTICTIGCRAEHGI